MPEYAPDFNSTIVSDVDTGNWYDPLTEFGTPKNQPENLYEARGKTRLGFDSSKYDISNLSYPDDVTSSVYGGNHVVFYINVSVDSKLVDNKKTQFVDDIDPRDRGELVAKNYSTAEVAAGTGLISSGIGTVIGLGGGSAGSGTLIGAGLGVGAVGAVATQSPGFTRAQKRLKSAISLHIPNTLNIQYNVNYSDEDTAGFATAAEIGRVLGDTARAIIDSPAKFSKDTLNKIGQGAKDLGPAATALGLSAAPSAVGAAAGLAPNPKKEQIFKNVDFRTFQFDYQFYPRDEKEAENVYNIINAFKLHMHPEYKDEDNFLFIYPSEFDIYYYTSTGENKYIHRHTSCVLSNMIVNYTPNAQFTTFRNGMPTQINLTLTFRELGIITKEKVQDGL